MVPAPRYSIFFIASAQILPIFMRCSTFRAGELASSQTFWWRRCSEQSRSPRWIALPAPSPTICISMWRGLPRYFSM